MTNIKRYFSFMKEYGMLLLIFSTAILKVFGDIANAISIKSFQWILDDLSKGENGLGFLAVLIMSILMNAACFYVKMILRAHGREGALKSIRMKFFKKVSTMYTGDLEDLKSGQIISASESINNLVDGGNYVFSELFMNLTLGTVITMVTMAITSIKLTLFSMAFVIPFGIIILVMGRKFGEYADRRYESYKKVRQQISRLEAFNLIKIFAKERYELKRMDEFTDEYADAGMKRKALNRDFNTLVILASAGLNVVLAIYAIYAVPKGLVQVGQLFVFYALIDRMIAPFYTLIDTVDSWNAWVVDEKKFSEVMDHYSEEDGGIDLVSFNNEIELDEVCFAYKSSDYVIEDLSLKINKGEKIGFYGESGGGKSTIAKLMSRLYSVESGAIMIDGLDIDMMSTESLHSMVGMISQDTIIFEDVSLRDNIAYGINATDAEVVAAAKKANAHEFIKGLENGYDSFVGKNGVKLSGGQKQRIALARLFLLNPPILILDEATSALDVDSEKIVQKSIDKLSKDKTVIAIAHRLSTIKNFDHLYCIGNHGIIEHGTPEELNNNKDSVWYKYTHK